MIERCQAVNKYVKINNEVKTFYRNFANMRIFVVKNDKVLDK